jgi:hydroxypyruvate reductase
MILSSVMEGEAREVAGVHAAIAKEILASGHPLRRPACVISGGETTVTLRGHGKGGRNQEFVLSAAAAIAGLRGVAILSGGTDGTDGPTDAAGAIATGSTIERASAAGLDWRTSLDRNDSYHFFDPLGDLIRTGPTRTNVMDVRVILVGAVH